MGSSAEQRTIFAVGNYLVYFRDIAHFLFDQNREKIQAGGFVHIKTRNQELRAGVKLRFGS